MFHFLLKIAFSDLICYVRHHIVIMRSGPVLTAIPRADRRFVHWSTNLPAINSTILSAETTNMYWVEFTVKTEKIVRCFLGSKFGRWPLPVEQNMFPIFMACGFPFFGHTMNMSSKIVEDISSFWLGLSPMVYQMLIMTMVCEMLREMLGLYSDILLKSWCTLIEWQGMDHGITSLVFIGPILQSY